MSSTTLDKAVNLTYDQLSDFMRFLRANCGLWESLARINSPNIAPIHKAMQNGLIPRDTLGDYDFVPYIVGVRVIADGEISLLNQTDKKEMASMQIRDAQQDHLKFYYLSKVTKQFVIHYAIPVARIQVHSNTIRLF